MNASSTNKPMRILLVENHGDTLHWLQLYLEDSGHTVIAATTFAEALGALRAGQCDVLLSDIGLPDGSGWDLIEQAKLQPPIFAIAMSGFGTNADSKRSQAAGYRHHLLKPFKTAELDKVLVEAATTLAPHDGK